VLLVDEASRPHAVECGLEPLPHLSTIVMLRDSDSAEARASLLSWRAFLALSHLAQEQTRQQRLASLQRDDLSTLIYTSGTTGPAKAVALSQGNLWWVGHTMRQLFDANGHDRVISYLPLAHIAEPMGSMHDQVHTGFTVYYAHSMEELGDHLKEVRPTMFFGVPRGLGEDAVWHGGQARSGHRREGCAGALGHAGGPTVARVGTGRPPARAMARHNTVHLRSTGTGSCF
jgi:long-chain acyl-CoA synthetase